jgi:hypothetical protein
MKKSVLKAAAIAGFSVLGASGAFAQSATQTIGLTAFVNAKCTIGTTVANESATGVAGDNIVVPTAGTTVASQALTPAVSSGNYSVTCTTPNKITITSANDGLKGATPLAGAFDNYINYTATVSQVGGVGPVLTGSLTTAGTGTLKTITTSATPAAFAGTMTIGVQTAANVNPLAPGSYSDTLTVLLTPQ